MQFFSLFFEQFPIYDIVLNGVMKNDTHKHTHSQALA